MLGLVVAAPASVSPAPVAAGIVESGVAEPVAAAGGRGSGKPGEDVDPVTEPEVRPSIHYRHALAHAGDEIAFQPGRRVSVEFTPRADDEWEVDGRAPKRLPPGHASGHEMIEALPGSAWAAGLPADIAIPTHFAEGREARDDAARQRPGDRRTGIDGATVPSGAIASGLDSGGIELASAVVDPSDEAVDAAPFGRGGLRREIFGFLPYWELSDSSTVLDWKTLSTVAYFSVGCTSSGNLQKRNPNGSTTTGWAGWTSSKMTSVINAAHRNHSRVVLTLSCFAWSSAGTSTQASLLRSSAARQRFARQAAAAVRDRGADGINLDFEPLVSGYADEFTSLVRAVRRELNAIARGYQLTFDTLGSIGNQPIEAATAPGGADAVLVMGYDYRTAGASVAGSISPLSGPVYDLTDTIRAYTSRISPSKVILGVPYYGRAWSTSTSALHARTLPAEKYGGSAEPSYAQAVALVTDNGRRWDSVEQAPWTAYRKRTCTARFGCVTSWRQLYYDDAASLRLRYDLVNRTNLRGAGIWALGYDDARPELRQALAAKFAADKAPPRVGVSTLAEHQRDEGFRVGWSSYDVSAIRSHDVQASVDGAPWRAWLTGSTLKSSIYLGTHGHTYAFRARAIDVHGNVSAWRSLALGALDAPSSIKVGGFATVLSAGLRMRTSPRLGAPVMAALADGAAVQVISGPAKADGYTWYQVAGPVRQWAPVEALHIGGWVVASGKGVQNLAPRTPVYATRVAAGMSGLRLANGGMRVLTPNGDGNQDTLGITWTNRRGFDALILRVYRSDGRLVGSVTLGAGKTRAGVQSYRWNGRVGGSTVRAGTYVLQLRAFAGSKSWNAPSSSPVSATQIQRWGVIVGRVAPTAVVGFRSPTSPTSARTLTWRVSFGGPISSLSAGDFYRVGTATGCRVGAPTGARAAWAVTVTGCSAGSVTLRLRARSVSDAIRNAGPVTDVGAPTLLIDRAEPTTGAPRAILRSGATLASTDRAAGLLATLTWSARDFGGAGVASYDIARSVDGRSFGVIASGQTAASLAVSIAPGHAYRFKVRARDRAGNVGRWQAGPTVRPALVQQASGALTYRRSWKLATNPGYSGGSAAYTSTPGAVLRFTFTGRAVAWVTHRARDRGAVRVYVDGKHVGTVDTRAGSPSARFVAFSRSWSRVGTHTLRLVVVGTTGRPRVDLDALEVLR